LLLSGDHILAGSTTVINPPDGDMVAYLKQLNRLSQLGANYIAPAHGPVLNDAANVMLHLQAHRLKREAKVLQSLTATPTIVSEMVKGVYDDVPESLHLMAQRSLLAHLLKLEHDGMARRQSADGIDQWERC
jgi:glyoxylase-like metal-dependent hydrolase (beta-lactamase superfamily II)